MAAFTFSAALVTGWREYRSRNATIENQTKVEEIETDQETEHHLTPGEIMASPDFFTWKAMTNEIESRLKNPKEVAMFAAVGAATGIIAGLLGVGGGVILLPLLTVLTDMPQQLIFGTVLSSFVPITVVGTISHSRAGNVVWRIMPGLFVGSAIGAYIGSRISIYLSETQQRGVVMAVMTSVGIKALVK